MSTRDIYHQAVKNALEKEGWIITADPLLIKIGGVKLYVDLAAERLIEAERNNDKIAVEIKSFVAASAISEFHGAVGQFINYRFALQQKEPERTLYLAVPWDVYQTFFSLPFVSKLIENQQIKLIVYNSTTELIVTWEN
ncbi:MAG: XisH family protein [Spirulinaceae cyanobacterium]